MTFSTTMLAVRKTKPVRGVDLCQVSTPNPGPDDLLLKVLKAGVCGSDKHLYLWDAWASEKFPTPLTLGHELVGEVVEVGSHVRDFRDGDIVAVESHVFDGNCRPCRTGHAHVCEDLKILGIDISGGFADFVSIPARVGWRVPECLPPDRAVLFEPLGNAVHAVMHYDVSGQPVAVYGCGPMGLMSIAVARAAGAYPIVATDISAYRRGLAVELGATATVDARSPSLKTDVTDALGCRPTVSMEMSGHPDAVQQALSISANGGKIVFLGIPPSPVQIDLANDYMFKGLQAYGVTGRLIWDTWYRSEAFLIHHGAELEPMLTHTFSLDRFEEAMNTVLSGECGKVLIDVGV